MTIPDAFLDELRARVGLVSVISRRVKLKKAGAEWKGCCPFHNEKTPSFYVNEAKGFYHCFGCGVHGDVIRFVVEQEGLRFPDAVRSLASECGLEVPETRPEDREREGRAASLADVMDQAARFYAEQLSGLAGADARRYLTERGLAPETVKRFGLGFAPAGKLTAALSRVAPAQLLDCGLLGQSEERGTYERFRNRLMFPIRDGRGRCVGFGARVLGTSGPKYLNSPDTPLFDKGRLLYNLDQAGPIARRAGRLFVVEGYMDVIGLAQAGIGEAVAPLGTSITEAQLQQLWRVLPEPLFCFDGDTAGTTAAVRAAVKALPLLEPGHSLRFVALPAGQDPDDLVRAKGREAFEAVAARAEAMIDRLWRSVMDQAQLDTPERRADAKRQLREMVETIRHPDVRRFYASEFAARFDKLFTTRKRDQHAPRPIQRAVGADVEAAALLAAVLHQPALLDDHLELLAELVPADQAGAGLLRAMLAMASAGDVDHLEGRLRADGVGGAIDQVKANAGSLAAIALRWFGAMLANVVARRRVEAELAAATARAGSVDGTEADFEAQRQLRVELDGLAAELRQMTAVAA